jgi:DNA-binding transcriptional LysR family regulator
MSKLEHIATFIAVVEENGFAAAARKKGLSTAAISRQIARLEATLSVQLLQRTTRQLTLTDLGAQYYHHCKNAVKQFTEAENAITGGKDEPAGLINITSSRYFAVKYLIPHLPEFMAAYPKLRINLELAERFPDLAQEGIDLLFGVSLEGPAGLVRRQVTTTRYVLCAAPAYLKKFGVPQTPKELSQHRYITHSIRKPANILTFKGGKEMYIEPILQLNDTRAMRECALKGMGIVKLHEYMVTSELENRRLIEVLPAYAEPQQPVYLYYQQTRYLPLKIRRFIDFYVPRIVKISKTTK